MSQKQNILFLFLIAVFLVSCTGPNESVDDLEAVAPGKEDNYYSSQAQEYQLNSSIPVDLTQAQWDQGEGKDLINNRLNAVGLYLTAYMMEKIPAAEITNSTYGGFHAMVRNQSFQTQQVSFDEQGRCLVSFAVDVAGPKDLLSKIPGQWDTESKGWQFEIKMPKNSAYPSDQIPYHEIFSFDPNNDYREMETVGFVAVPQEISPNAWPKYQAFMQDGVYDLTLFFGMDNSPERSDLIMYRVTFELLRVLGFKAPVSKASELKCDSGPFVKTIRANGQEIRTEVRLFHADMFANAAVLQRELFLSELASRDVFFYEGHGAPYRNFYLSDDPASTITPEELRVYPLNSEKQQLLVVNACLAYSQYADYLYANPNKSYDNLDAISTVNTALSLSTLSQLTDLIKTDWRGRHVPVDYYQVVKNLNEDIILQAINKAVDAIIAVADLLGWVNPSWKVSGVDQFRNFSIMPMYGIIGLDENPKLHPYAHFSQIGKACLFASDCGDSNAYVCLNAKGTGRSCGAVSLDAFSCPEGSSFYQVAKDKAIIGGACF